MGHVLTSKSTQRARFRARLLAWYRAHRRELPWRQTSDPYGIWVSEIMLQQTRVAAVLEHYTSFLRRFPDVSALAQAPLPEVLAAWSGLGYYRRARALHAAAQLLQSNHGGQLPRKSQELLPLPGFGRYTASAVASIAFGEPVAVLDGNVERVLRRLLGTSDANTKALWSAAETLLSRRSPGDFNQAMMELGATVCLPGEPRCSGCPVKRWCAVRGSLPRGKQPIRSSQEISVMLLRKQGRISLVRRSESVSVMPGLWELPSAAKTASMNGESPVLVVRHAIMNTSYRVSVFAEAPRRIAGARWVPEDGVFDLPLTGLARKILRRVLFAGANA